VGTYLIGDELKERPVGIAEVHALAFAARAVAGQWAELDLDAVRAQVRDGVVDRPLPDEAQVAVARSDAARGSFPARAR
jgi:hypothetical protein